MRMESHETLCFFSRKMHPGVDVGNLSVRRPGRDQACSDALYHCKNEVGGADRTAM